MNTTDRVVRLLDAAGVERALEQLAAEIRAGGNPEDLVIIGIRRRGVELAARIAAFLEADLGHPIPSGSLDITLYRDDFGQVGALPVIGVTEIPVEITERRVVIVDDVLYTGRTIRAALNELADFGRPRRIELCILVDRGGRELPIQADYVGLKVDAGVHDQVVVNVPELDDDCSVTLVPGDKGE